MTLNTKALVWVATAILAVIALSLSPFALAQDEEMLLNTGDAMKTQRTAVVFPHDLHMGLYECLDCHHDYKEGVNVLDEDTLEEGNPDIRCAACHNDQADVDRQKAYHRQCMGCHIDTRKAGDASGPELCGACHLSAR
jgi:c(7)-type cytochrome triheme protein